MTAFAPLRPSDPERLGDHRILGRLGEGGQGVVYLAENSEGRRVAIKWLRAELAGDEVSVTRFMREVQVAERVAPFCTAAVLAKGVEQERPFIVSEYIEGPSLQRIVLDEGPRSGSALHRLAVGTATALAAIHQAGIVHRDFKPANVLLAADGPRVIDFGIARALNANVTISNMPVGTPSYMAPEQIMGEQVGAAADLFSWANTMVFAATTQAPFGNDTMHAVINRVLNQEPDLGNLDGPLRDVVAQCLSKNPAMRPTAEQVIMRLLQHPSAAPVVLQDAAAAAAGPPSPMTGPAPMPAAPPYHAQPGPQPGPHQQAPPQQQPPPRAPSRGGSRKGLLVGAVTAFVAVLVAGLLILAPWKPTSQTTPPVAQPTRTAQQEPQVTPVRLPGGAATLYESAKDPVRLTSYEIKNESGEWADYARASLTGTFAPQPKHWESLVSPNGRYLAGRARNYTADGFDPVNIIDRKSGENFTVKTVREPAGAQVRGWSRDGTKVLLNVERQIDGAWAHLGFAVLDVKTRKVKITQVAKGPGLAPFGWDGTDDGVVTWDERNRALVFYDLDGKRTRTLKDLGTLPAGTDRLFSPSGSTFVTTCPGGEEHCVWDTASGERKQSFTSDCDKVLGWYDENHLYCWELNNGKQYEVQVVDFEGKAVRRLLESSKALSISPVFTVNPRTS
ncbi:MAG: serine/threonine protein kinase [Thermoactinospora sp.]|nr:serine/threonine protein kinase [Thermoactinospora sp.]